ncbi:MAG TPA: SagB/ThcOx family dehydrogenase, partial [Kiritimatiellia bacterium]|nr:SagB/ThcOx family dehydrogenase [Kiritimatiellia bacterium]
MNNIKISILSVGMAALALGSWAFAAERADIPLPSPRMDGGMPLLQALKQRQSARAFSPNALPEHVVADLLWAAFGINRPDTGKRTAPSA